MDRDTLLMTYQHPSTDSCSICMEHLEASQSVRIIAGCAHTFHAGCLETWLAQNPMCPLCRHVLPTLGAEMREQLFYRELRRIFELLLAYTPPQAVTADALERYLLTYTLIHGITKRFPTAMGHDGLLASAGAIQQQLGDLEVRGVRPLPFEVRSLYALKKLERGVASYLANHYGCSQLRVSRLPALADWKGGVQAIAGIGAVWSAF